MEEYQEFYSKIILIKNSEVDHDSLINGAVALEIDAAYSIGKSVAALVDGEVIGHLPRYVAKPIWLKLKFGFRIEATIYDSLEKAITDLQSYVDHGSKRANLVIFLTDGEANVGGSGEERRLIESLYVPALLFV